MKVGVDDWADATGATAADLDALPRIEMVPTLAPAARYGFVGRVVDGLDPYSEADPAATLISMLVMVGNVIGPGPHAQVAADCHPLRENALLVGPTGKGRKGMSWAGPRELIRRADPSWRERSGASSGEGLIYHIRDAREEQQPIKERGRVVGYERVVVDEGESDKRLGLVEPEFSTVLRRMEGESNSLSQVIRMAWDTGDLSTLTKNSPLKATGAHVSIVGHITAEELVALIHEVSMANGFLNRFVVGLVRRSKMLPDGAVIPESVLGPLAIELAQILSAGRRIDLVQRDDEAADMWRAIYADLSDGRDGLVGAILGRAEAHVLRLSAIYAVLDGSALIRPAHLEAALAVWLYSEASVKAIFGDRLGLPLADQILDALRKQGPMTRNELRDLFSRHRSARELDHAIEALLGRGLVRQRIERTAGRPRTVIEVVA
jgi:hypothetical protein